MPTPHQQRPAKVCVLFTPPLKLRFSIQMTMCFRSAVTTTEAHAPLWLLNACNALDFLTRTPQGDDDPLASSSPSGASRAPGRLRRRGAPPRSHPSRPRAPSPSASELAQAAQDSAAAKAAADAPPVAVIEDAAGTTY